MKDKFVGTILTIFLVAFMTIMILGKTVLSKPNEVYQVYLNGNKLGIIESKEKLLNMIDNEQSEIKEKYNVNKVYPPSGLEIKKLYTYSDDIEKENEIYKLIKEEEPFTIEGYILTITYTEAEIKNDVENTGEIKKPVHISLLKKDIVEDALRKTAEAFIGTDKLNSYQNETQVEITDTGEIISSVFFEETITVKKGYVSTKDYLFDNVENLSKYLLYNTLENQQSYVVKDGENLDAIADNHKLNIEELLIANPQFPSANVLLTAGDKVNVGLIDPLIHVVYKKTVVEDIKVNYKTEYINDSSKFSSYKETVTEGQNGLTRITQDIKYVNGEINSLVITNRETIKNVVNEVIKRGTKINENQFQSYENIAGNDKWSWPTISPFVITSRYKWRWGKMHQGIDISGTGYGSPIYSVAGGTVIAVNHDARKNEGLSIYVDHGNKVITQYMHLSKILVSVGQQVSKEQKIGLMGSTGASTGTHLHLGVWLNGRPYQGGTAVDPCSSIFKC